MHEHTYPRTVYMQVAAAKAAPIARMVVSDDEDEQDLPLAARLALATTKAAAKPAVAVTATVLASKATVAAAPKPAVLAAKPSMAAAPMTSAVAAKATVAVAVPKAKKAIVSADPCLDTEDEDDDGMTVAEAEKASLRYAARDVVCWCGGVAV